jgi:hypothetical protein
MLEQSQFSDIGKSNVGMLEGSDVHLIDSTCELLAEGLVNIGE